MAAITISDFARKKEVGEKISMLTCYDYTMAYLMQDCGIDALLVGDSLGMTVLGYKDTLSVTMQDMIRHTQAVRRGAGEMFVVADMPFMSYQADIKEAVTNAGRLVKEGGAQAVKLEGGADYVDVIRAIVRAGIPVMGHIGLTPQAVNALGGYRVQAKTEVAVRQFENDAKAIEEAGCFAAVFECVPHEVAAFVTKKTTMATIGIGAGVDCDGQVLVWQDMSGLNEDFSPKFVQRFSQAGKALKEGFKAYSQAVQKKEFPDVAHSFSASEDVLKKLY